uniref:Uncharacterized protein n=1 Tax=Triticum urartu TaxID=4572 RepID=A0A8R7PWD5_TRIUA
MSSWSSSVEKMKRWMVMPAAAGVEAKLLCVVCSVPRPEDPPVQGDYVEQRVHHSIKRLGYVLDAK